MIDPKYNRKVKPNKLQQEWLSVVADYGCAIPCPKGMTKGQIHHVAGRTHVHNKIPIGQEYIYMIPYDYHDIKGAGAPDNPEVHIDRDKKEYIKRFGTQLSIFISMLKGMERRDIDWRKYITEEQFDAICTTPKK